MQACLRKCTVCVCDKNIFLKIFTVSGELSILRILRTATNSHKMGYAQLCRIATVTIVILSSILNTTVSAKVRTCMSNSDQF